MAKGKPIRWKFWAFAILVLVAFVLGGIARSKTSDDATTLKTRVTVSRNKCRQHATTFNARLVNNSGSKRYFTVLVGGVQVQAGVLAPAKSISYTLQSTSSDRTKIEVKIGTAPKEQDTALESQLLNC